jgi:hypothetical protein
METKEKKVYGLLLPEFSLTRDHSAFVKVHIVEVFNDGSIRNPGSYDESGFEDLVFSALVDAQRSDGTSEVFGYDLEYRDLYTVGLMKAETILKTLRKARRLRGNFPFEPQSFGQYVAMLAKGLGITKVVQAVEGQSVMGSYNENKYRIRDLAYAAGMVDDLTRKAIEAWRKEHNVTETA